jgi:hypothetical protein
MSNFHGEAMQRSLIPQPPVKPWFREPWPWLIMLGPFVVVIAGLATAVIAYRYADPLVADDYYKQGLAINRLLEREQRALDLHVAGTAWYAAEMGRVRIQLTAGAALPPALILRLAHPTRAGMDQSVVLRSVQPGIYDGAVTLAEPVRWLVTLEAGDWQLATEWDGRGPLTLGSPAVAVTR